MGTSEPLVVRLTVTNYSETSQRVVLEPRGMVYELEPGASREIAHSGDRRPHIGITFEDDELKLWEEGEGDLDLLSPADR